MQEARLIVLASWQARLSSSSLSRAGDEIRAFELLISDSSVILLYSRPQRAYSTAPVGFTHLRVGWTAGLMPLPYFWASR